MEDLEVDVVVFVLLFFVVLVVLVVLWEDYVYWFELLLLVGV